MNCPTCQRRWSSLEVITHELIPDPENPSQPGRRQVRSKPIIFYPTGRTREFDPKSIAAALTRFFMDSPL